MLCPMNPQPIANSAMNTTTDHALSRTIDASLRSMIPPDPRTGEATTTGSDRRRPVSHTGTGRCAGHPPGDRVCAGPRGAPVNAVDTTADVVVIGAGHNGLTAANYLADARRQVVVLEAAARIG